MPDSTPKTPPRGALPALAGGYFTLAVASLSVVGLLGHMSEGLAVSKSSIAYLVTAFALTYAVAAPALQMLAGDLDRRTLVLTGLCTIAVGAVTNAAAVSYEMALAGRCIMAIGASAVGPMASAAGAGLVAPERRGAALGMVFAGFTVASVMGVPLTAFAGDVIGWRATLMVIAVLAVCVAAAVGMTVPAGGRGARASVRSILATLFDKRTGSGLLVTMLQMGSQFVTFAVIAAYASSRFGIAETLNPLILLLYGVGGIIGNAIATRLADLVGPERLILASLLMTTSVFVVMQLAPSNAFLGFVLMFVWSVAGMMMYAPQQSRLVSLAPETGNLLLALNASMLYLGMAGGALLSGILYAQSGTQYLAIGSALFMLTAAGAFLYSVHMARQT